MGGLSRRLGRIEVAYLRLLPQPFEPPRPPLERLEVRWVGEDEACPAGPPGTPPGGQPPGRPGVIALLVEVVDDRPL